MESPQKDIRTALLARRKEIRKRLDVLNGKAVRRMLEGDLGLEAKHLDQYKALVNNLIDEVVIGNNKESQEEPQKDTQPQPKGEAAQRKDTKPNRDQETGASRLTKRRKGDEEDDIAVAKDQKPKSKAKPVKEQTTRKKAAETSKKRKSKDLSDDDDEEEDGSIEGDESGSDSDEEADHRPTKKDSKPKAKPAPKEPAGGPKFSKKVEQLRDICKKATLKIPPSMYKRGPEGSEDRVVEALESLLAKHGLDAHSKDHEIKAAKKQIERMRDLEGIDTSNIMEAAGGRPRRAAASINFKAIYNQMGEGGSDAEELEGSGEEDGGRRFGGKQRSAANCSVSVTAKKRDRDGAHGSSMGEEEEGEEEEGSQAKRGRSLSAEPSKKNECVEAVVGGGGSTKETPGTCGKSEQSWGSEDGEEEHDQNPQPQPQPSNTQDEGLEDEGVPTPAGAGARKSPGNGSRGVTQKVGRRRAAFEDDDEENDDKEAGEGQHQDKAEPAKGRKTAPKARKPAVAESEESEEEEASEEEEEVSDFQPSDDSD